MTIQVKSSSRAYKVTVRVLAREPENSYEAVGIDERQFLDELLGRGSGDPDFHTPPWEAEDVA